MRQNEGLPLIKLMMLISSLAPVFILIGIRGISNEIVQEKIVWYSIAALMIIPALFLQLRIELAKKNKDLFSLNVKNATLNKEYLFTYLLTVLLPLYSVAIISRRDLYGIMAAIFFVIFIMWNLNMHFLNVVFAFRGYRVYTLTNHNSAILLSTRQQINTDIDSIIAHRLSNSVFIELKKYSYDNK